MKRFLLAIPTLVTLVLLQTSIYSQAFFHLETDTLANPNPVNFNDSIFYRFTIFNQGNVNFNDSLFIVRQVNGFVDTIFTYDSVILDTIPSDSFQANVGDQVSPARYGGGINVVVIWPTGPNTSPPTLTDSISGSVWVLGATSLPEPYAEASLQVYPNPSADQLRFTTNIPTTAIESVQLFGTDGKMVNSMDHLPASLSLGHLPKGLYLLQIHFKGGSHRTLRVVRN